MVICFEEHGISRPVGGGGTGILAPYGGGNAGGDGHDGEPEDAWVLGEQLKDGAL